eukprot:TRINITY_DN5504_c0_g1_i5.p1 TRINITY_DN5504_c0_g1~~TRINITY_DN5504_c0_g1_i5.p1  ORF type:complete len:226 (+),score=46.43 TRINITY_DN5504_c0_g1_i5:64-741(+)
MCIRDRRRVHGVFSTTTAAAEYIRSTIAPGPDVSVDKLASILHKFHGELIDHIESVNFSLLVHYGAKHDLQKIRNRVLIYWIHKKKEALGKIANILGALSKILSEEFLEATAEQTNEQYYFAKLKENMKIIAPPQAQQNDEEEEKKDEVREEEVSVVDDELYLNYVILKEHRSFQHLKHLEGEFLRRILMGELFAKLPAHDEVEPEDVASQHGDVMALLRGLEKL